MALAKRALRVGDDAWARWGRAAAAQGLSLGEFIRRTTDRGLPARQRIPLEPPTAEVRAIWRSGRPRLLDLYSGAGGAGAGYVQAGFEVVGVDHVDQPNYPWVFECHDALAYLREIIARDSEFDVAHASPPCLLHSRTRGYHPGAEYDDLIAETRELLLATGKPFVIENVPGAPIRHDLLLCGEMFGLGVHRHRYFEIEGLHVDQPLHAAHDLGGALHNCHVEEGHARLVAGNYADHAGAGRAMGVGWMTRRELANAVPPAFTEYIGARLIRQAG